jgi:predicted nuclease with TOPRIM domain
VAGRLLQAGGDAAGGAIGEDLRQRGDEIDDVQRRLEGVETEIAALEESVVTERDVLDALERLEPVWDELFPAEQARIVRLLVERVEVYSDGLQVTLLGEGLRSLAIEIGAAEKEDAT